MPIIPVEWRRNDLDELPVDDPNAKGVFVQVWGRGPDGVTSGVLCHFDSKGNLDKYKSGCIPIPIQVLCKVTCNNCRLDRTFGDLILPPGVVRIRKNITVEYQCCPC